MVFKAGDATPKQVAAAAKRWREEARQGLITQQAKKVQCTTLFVPTPFLVILGFYRLSLFPTGTLHRSTRKEAGHKPTGPETATNRGPSRRGPGLHPIASGGRGS